jgi:hypothetical protein
VIHSIFLTRPWGETRKKTRENPASRNALHSFVPKCAFVLDIFSMQREAFSIYRLNSQRNLQH